MISRIIEVSVGIISLSLRLRLITPTSTSIILDITKTSSNNCLLFDALQYATDFSTISKESLKRITKWGAKYFTHPSSYYPVPQTGMSFKDLRFMTLLPPDELSKVKEQTIKDWLENYRPVR